MHILTTPVAAESCYFLDFFGVILKLPSAVKMHEIISNFLPIISSFQLKYVHNDTKKT